MTTDNDKKRAFPTPKTEQNFTRWSRTADPDTHALLAQIDSLVIQRDAAEALARERTDPSHARAMADAVADRLFVEGERDAALHDLAIARDHLEGANNAHAEAEKDLAAAVDRAERNETARRDAVALWTKQAEHCRQMVADLAISRDQTDRAERISSDRLNLLKAALVEKDAAERRESELGLQVVAQAARLRLAEGLADACASGSITDVNVALAAWDAVPGDEGQP